jgi:hypothetical protein
VEWRREWQAETLLLDSGSGTGVVVVPRPCRALLLDQDVVHRLVAPAPVSDLLVTAGCVVQLQHSRMHVALVACPWWQQLVHEQCGEQASGYPLLHQHINMGSWMVSGLLSCASRTTHKCPLCFACVLLPATHSAACPSSHAIKPPRQQGGRATAWCGS